LRVHLDLIHDGIQDGARDRATRPRRGAFVTKALAVLCAEQERRTMESGDASYRR
jgi:hypothetical protein